MKRYFRICTNLSDACLVDDLLRAQNFSFSELSFWKRGRGLEFAPVSLGSSLAAFFGLIYIQDKSSMLPPIALQPASGELVLDMCASPGSKTGMLSAMVGESGLVLANEPTPSRLNVLRRNMQHQGILNVISCGFKGEDLPLPDACVPYILLDVPCSGWGTEEKNPGIREFWSEDKLGSLLDVQKRLLASAARLLAPGGRLVYSTCTTNVRENEEQVNWALKHLDLLPARIERPAGVLHKIQDEQNFFRVESVKNESQGFFVAAFLKEGASCPACPSESYVSPVTYAGLDAFFRDLERKKEIFSVNKKVFRVPGRIKELFGKNSFQGAYLGKVNKKGYQGCSRLRETIPRDFEPEKGVVFDNINDLMGLVHGQSLASPVHSGPCPIYWKGLPLGWARAKNGRLLWTEK
ncbi:MAG: RsmB/NOP family class I SAM-dependent RNA methyltransferase [Thermodesulfobacteriota bacterium]